MAKISQRAKLVLKANENALTKDVKNDYYLTVKKQRSLSMGDLAQEVAANHGHQNKSEVEMLASELLELAAWYLSCGYTVTTPLGYFRTGVNGVFLESELNAAPDRNRMKLSVNYFMSDLMRKALSNAQLDVEIEKAKTGPQLYAVVSTYNAKNPEAATRGEGVPVSAGETCIIRGRNLKVGGPDEAQPGVTLMRVDKANQQPVFIPAVKLFPNTSSQVGFIMPTDAEEGSVWEVSICTQLAANGSTVLKESRKSMMENTFVVGETGEITPPDGDGGGGDDGEDPLG